MRFYLLWSLRWLLTRKLSDSNGLNLWKFPLSILHLKQGLVLKESFNRNKRAFDKSPKEWIGWDSDPENPEYQKRRKISIKIFDKFLKD